jgi:hypothetical protein
MLQTSSSGRVSLAYKQRPAPHAIIDLRNVPSFVPDNQYVALTPSAPHADIDVALQA